MLRLAITGNVKKILRAGELNQLSCSVSADRISEAGVGWREQALAPSMFDNWGALGIVSPI
jgi:hypothetical protein